MDFIIERIDRFLDKGDPISEETQEHSTETVSPEQVSFQLIRIVLGKSFPSNNYSINLHRAGIL